MGFEPRPPDRFGCKVSGLQHGPTTPLDSCEVAEKGPEQSIKSLGISQTEQHARGLNHSYDF